MKTKFLSLLFVLFAGYCATAQAKDKKTATVETVQQNDLDKIKGNYVSKENPNGMLLYVQGGKLMGKVPGQASIAFEPAGRNTFKSEKADMIVQYNADKKQVIVTQKGATQTLTLQ